MPSSAPTEVAARLERLAEQAPLRLDDPNQLWSRGRRRQRGRWAGTAAGLVAAAVLGAVAVPPVLDGTRGMVAVSPDADLVLPDLVRQPGEWERSFPSAPGRLVAVGIGTRGGWWSSRYAWWGVSATTAESRFLDLPDAVTATDAQPALSADGRLLAYWFTGKTAEEPFRAQDASPAVGVAVLDLETGEVDRWGTDTPRGLMTNGLAWAGDVLWWSGGPYNKGSTTSQWSATVDVHTWDLTSDERRDLQKGTPAHRADVSMARPAPGGFLLEGRQDRLHLVQGDAVARVIQPDADVDVVAPALSPDGTHLAGINDADPEVFTDEPDPLVVGDLGTTPTRMDPVGGVEARAVHGWRSDDEVVIETYTGADMGRVYGASVVDIDTGEVTHLLDFRGNVPSFAADAWSAEVVEAPDAPWAPDPRVVAFVVLMLGWAALKMTRVVGRRRVGG